MNKKLLPNGLKNFSIVLDHIHDNIYLIGGQVYNGDSDKIYIFDLNTDSIRQALVEIPGYINGKKYCKKGDMLRLNIPRYNAKTIINDNII